MSYVHAVERSTSPVPTDPDVLVRVVLRGPKPCSFTFLACWSAARQFAEHWSTYNPNGTVEFDTPDRHCARLPCERLWIVP